MQILEWWTGFSACTASACGLRGKSYGRSGRPRVCPVRTISVYLPDTAATIADRISQKSHHDWIEAFLVSHREVRSAEQHQGSTH
jgi:hypothetical protein